MNPGAGRRLLNWLSYSHVNHKLIRSVTLVQLLSFWHVVRTVLTLAYAVGHVTPYTYDHVTYMQPQKHSALMPFTAVFMGVGLRHINAHSSIFLVRSGQDFIPKLLKHWYLPLLISCKNNPCTYFPGTACSLTNSASGDAGHSNIDSAVKGTVNVFLPVSFFCPSHAVGCLGRGAEWEQLEEHVGCRCNARPAYSLLEG